MIVYVLQRNITLFLVNMSINNTHIYYHFIVTCIFFSKWKKKVELNNQLEERQHSYVKYLDKI